MTEKLYYPLFDGERVWEAACITVENGIITSVKECGVSECDSRFLLMPGLIDAHAHMRSAEHVKNMLQSGVTTVCDVSAPLSLIQESKQLSIHNSGGMAMGIVLNGKDYVENALKNGARYIKVLLFNTFSIGKPALKGIIKAAHERGLKVAVHATELATVKQAVDCGADILLHVPLKEAFPDELADKIADKGIAVVPTLVMMKAFAESGRNKYQPRDYQNAVGAVKTLRAHGVRILVGTDANIGSFSPAVAFGSSMHKEMELLVQAGIAPFEALRAATRYNAESFCLHAGRITVGEPASMILVEGRPDRDIRDISKIQKIWTNGCKILG